MIGGALAICIAGMVASLAVGKWREKSASYTKSTDEFDVFLSNDYLAVLYLGALFCFGCGLLSVFMAPDQKGAILTFLILGIIIAAFIPLAKQKISVKGNTITVKKLLSTQAYRFSDITHYSGSDVTTVYKGQKVLFTFDIDCIGANNMLDRLKQEGITKTERVHQSSDGVQQKVQVDVTDRTIRKEEVLSLKNNSSIVAIAVMFAILGVLGLLLHPAFGLILLALGILICLFMYLIGPMKYYSIMTNMEKAMGIDINAEMAELGVTDFRHSTGKWFLANNNPYKLILHRDYIQDVLQILPRSSGWYEITFTAVDGRRVAFRTLGQENFVKWYGLSESEAERLGTTYWFRHILNEEPENEHKNPEE